MQRKEVTLGKDTVLWEEGDVARDIAVVTRGRLGARTEKGLMGVILPPMVVGESALFGAARSERRTATLFALEDGTQVRQYPADVVRQALEGGDESLVRQVVNTLVGQICRNLLMVITSRRGYAFIDTPLMSLVREIVHDAQEARPIKDWDNLFLTFRFLYDLRDVSDRLLEQLGPDLAERSEMLTNASQLLTQLSEGEDVRPLVESFLQAEQQKNEWWARGALHP
jgi:hypothetical protein